MWNFPIIEYKHCSKELQVALICVLYVARVLVVYAWYLWNGYGFQIYPITITLFIAPIYEELFFRGVIFSQCKKHYSLRVSIVVSSAIFGIRHIKNIFYHPTIDSSLWQIMYTWLIVWPILAYVYHKTWNIRLCIILHYLNNIIVGIVLLYWL